MATCAVAPAQELTVQSIYGSAGLTGRSPDTVKWSPDGKKVSYFLHQEQGEKADLYYIDVTSGKPAVLVASEKLAAMKPPVSASKDDRERDNRERYRVAGYHWAPDSEHILFDANGQLWYYTLSSGTSVALSTPGDYVAFEHLTYSQIARSVGLIGRRIALVASDEEGLDPEDFERVCAQKHPKMIFLMPTVQNPTLAILSVSRREAIARVARAYNVILIEDDLR